MDEQHDKVICKECGEVLDELWSVAEAERIPCPKCGSKKRQFDIQIHETITIREKWKMKGRHADQSKPFVEQAQGDDLHRKTGQWHQLTRVIDRENNHYTEKIIDSETGDVVHECDEPLSEHQGHGSAKYKTGDKR